MSKLVAKSFQSRATFYLHIAEISDKFDVEKSLGMPYFCYQTVEGKEFKFKILSHFLRSLNQECGTKFVDSKSVNRRNSFIIFYEEQDLPTEKVGIVLEKPVTEPTPVVEVLEEVSDEVSDTPVEAPQDALVDWLDEVKALYDPSDKRGSKDKLEALGRTMDVELNKQKSFDNMVLELVELVGKES